MPKTIIWIEDDTDIIDSVVRPLEKANYIIIRLRTVKEVLDSIDKLRQSDLILLDMILSPSNTHHEFGRYPGLSLLREIRGRHQINVPVVALTVVNQEEVIRQLRELGVADIIRKPVRPSELKARVEKALVQSR